jgi:hypothetical protein
MLDFAWHIIAFPAIPKPLLVVAVVAAALLPLLLVVAVAVEVPVPPLPHKQQTLPWILPAPWLREPTTLCSSSFCLLEYLIHSYRVT